MYGAAPRAHHNARACFGYGFRARNGSASQYRRQKLLASREFLGLLLGVMMPLRVLASAYYIFAIRAFEGRIYAAGFARLAAARFLCRCFAGHMFCFRQRVLA